jgi:hypothetical protein
MITNMRSPFRDMRLLQEEVNRLAQGAAAPRERLCSPRRDRHHGGTARREKNDDLEITVHRDTVTLRGERQDELGEEATS